MRSLVAASIAFLVLAGSATALAATGGLDPSFPAPSTWATVTTWHYPPAPGADFIIKRQLGTTTDTADDTSLVTVAGHETHSSPWEQIDVTRFGVPRSATAVQLQFKAVITGISNSETTVYAFVKQDGADICPGPPGFTNQPTDFTWDGEAGAGGEKCWAVHASIDGLNGVREFNTVTVPVTNGTVDFAWGYRKAAGQWPNGSAVAVGVWLNGWAD